MRSFRFAVQAQPPKFPNFRRSVNLRYNFLFLRSPYAHARRRLEDRL
jgi:hypothetical protein